jgi:hypothetical protein
MTNELRMIKAMLETRAEIRTITTALLKFGMDAHNQATTNFYNGFALALNRALINHRLDAYPMITKLPEIGEVTLPERATARELIVQEIDNAIANNAQ